MQAVENEQFKNVAGRKI